MGAKNKIIASLSVGLLILLVVNLTLGLNLYSLNSRIANLEAHKDATVWRLSRLSTGSHDDYSLKTNIRTGSQKKTNIRTGSQKKSLIAS